MNSTEIYRNLLMKKITKKAG